MKISSKNQNIAGVTPLHLIQKSQGSPNGNPQPDKTGMHILLKLASLVVILAGIHAAADIILQLLLALFLPSFSTRSSRFIRRGVQRPVAITIVVVVMLIALTALVGVLAASFNEFISMLPKFNKELTRKLLNCRRCCLFLICICRRSEYYSGWTRKSGYLHHGANDRAFRGNGERALLVMTVVLCCLKCATSLTKCVSR